MITDHFAMLHSENEIGIPDRVASQINMLLLVFQLYTKKLMVDGVHCCKDVKSLL